MAQPGSTHETYDTNLTSQREDLKDKIEMLLPTETPLLTMAGRGPKPKATFHEWQLAELAAAIDTNSVAEGDAATMDAAKATVRVGNYTNIADKTVNITGTQMAVDHAGIPNMKAFQLVNKARELKRDIDKQICSNKASNAGAGDAATARVSGGYESMIGTRNGTVTENASRGSGGSSLSYNAGVWEAPTDGTARAITEDMLVAVLASCWDQGGNPTKVICGSWNKRKISGFTGGATRFDKSEDKKLTNAIDVYVGDFGEVSIIPSRQVRTRSVLVVDPMLWKVNFLRDYQTEELPFAGDSKIWQLLCEYVLEGCNPQGSGIIADLTTS